MKPFRSIRLRIQLIVGLLVVGLVAISALSVEHALEQRRQARRVAEIAAASRDLFTELNLFRLERGATAGLIATPGTPDPVEIRYQGELRAQSSPRLRAVLARLAAVSPNGDDFRQVEIARLFDRLQALRAQSDAAIRLPADQRPGDMHARFIAGMTELTDALADATARLSAEMGRDDAFIARMSNIGRLAWTVRAAAGDDSLRWWTAAIIGRRLEPGQVELFQALKERIDAPWAVLKDDAAHDGAPPEVTAAIAQAGRLYYQVDRRMRSDILDHLTRGQAAPTPNASNRRINNAGLGSLMGVADAALGAVAAHAGAQAAEAERDAYLALAAMAGSIALGALIVVFASMQVLSPIARITLAMRAVADGALHHPIPDLQRPDEVGELARALDVFRANAEAKQAMNAQLLESRIAKETAEASARAKAQFLANMSHEIRTPLTAVIGFADLMATRGGLPKAAEAYTQHIQSGGKALLALVNDILDVSRIEAGQMELDSAPCAPERLLGDTLDLVRLQADRKGLALVLDVSDGLPALVAADTTRLRQVLLNLVGNAIKFTQQGSVTVHARHRADLGGRLLIRVKDTGAGIDEQDRHRLFHRFSQIDASNTRQFGGAGLGLAITKGLVELMGGEIGIEPATEPGSTFWFDIPAPAIAAGDPAEAALATKPPAERLAPTPFRILIVDDVAVNRELVSAMLSPFDLHLSEAANGAEAVAAADRDRFDLILMDLQMPVMDGLAATRAIRNASEHNASTPILALSANVMEQQVEACRAAGMNDHIAKPISPADLLSKIDRWAAGAEAVA